MKSGHVRSQDLHALFHLAGELADHPAGDAKGALQHLLEQFSRILGARGGIWVCSARIMSGEEAAGDPLCGWRPTHGYDFDPEPGVREIRLRWANHLPNIYVDPITQALVRLHDRHRTFLRPELVDDRTWERSALFNEVLRPFGIGDRLFGMFSVAADLEVLVSLDRNIGEKPFGVREREVFRAAVEGLDWFHRRILSELELIEAAQTLTARERQVLSLLLSDRSEKQIALALGLTVRTTHFYVTSIYRKFHVHSRAEMMALWLRRSK